MPSLPVPIPAQLTLYWPALLALAIALAATWLGRGKGRQGWVRPGLALAALLGWAALEPWGRLHTALAPPVAPAMLIVASALVLLVEAARVWRGGRNDRLLSFLAAVLVGWWLARVAAGPAEFWRVGIVTAVLVAAVAMLVRGRPGRGLALALALWGGMAVTDYPAPWLVAAAVLVAIWAAPLALSAKFVPSAALAAAVLAGADLARGRLARGRLDGADLACVAALAAPLLMALIEPRRGKRWSPLAPVLAAAVAMAAAWGLRRVVLG